MSDYRPVRAIVSPRIPGKPPAERIRSRRPGTTLAALLFGLAVAWLLPGTAEAATYVKSVEYLEIAIPGGTDTTSANLTKGQVAANCVPFASVRSTQTGLFYDLGRTFVDISLAAGSPPTVTARSTYAGGGPVDVGVFVVEFDPTQVRVQQGTFSMTAGTPAVGAAIASVNLAKSALVFYHRAQGTNPNEWSDFAVEGSFATATNLNFWRDSSQGALNGHWYVFEAIGSQFSVQTRTFSLPAGSASGSVAISAVDLSRTSVFASYRTQFDSAGATFDVEDGALSVYLPVSATQVTAVRQYANSASNVVDYLTAFVVTWAGDVRVQRGQVDFASTDVTKQATITAVSPSSIVVGGTVGPGAQQTDGDALADLDKGFYRLKLANSTTVQLDRDTASACGSSCAGKPWYEVIDFQPANTMQVETGTYLGNGTSSRAITGVGFRPDLVIVTSNETCANAAGTTYPCGFASVLRTSTLPGISKSIYTYANHPLNNRVQSLDADGFTVDHPPSHNSPYDDPTTPIHCVNHGGVRYYWTAFKAAAGEMVVGQYGGNGAATQDITTVGFQPGYVIVLPDSTERVFQRSSSMPALYSYDFDGGSACSLGCAFSAAIRSMLTNGFQVGSGGAGGGFLNQSSTTYHYVAWKATPGKIAVGSYATGATPSDNRSIAGVGFRPEYAHVLRGGTPSGGTTVAKTSATGVSRDYSLWSMYYGGFSPGTPLTPTDAIQALEADGFQVGTANEVNQANSTHYWVAFDDETSAPTGSMQVLSGSYAGNGTSQSITVGFRPDVVFIKSDQAADDGVVHTSTMATNSTKSLYAGAALPTGTAPFAGGVTSLDNLGFGVGAEGRVNRSGSSYVWVAFKAAPGELHVGAYTGLTGADNRIIPGVGFSPEYVIVLPDGAYAPMQRSSTMAADTSYAFKGLQSTTSIKALEADGFRLGTDQTVNQSGTTYHYLAWNAAPGRVAVGSYTGNAPTDNRAVDDAGFRPEWVIVRPNLNGTRTTHKPRSSGALTDLAYPFEAASPLPNTIQSLRAAGFSVGTDGTVNTNGQVYHWVAFGPADGGQAAGALANPTAGCGVSGARSPLDKVSQRKVVRDANGYKYLVFAKFRETTPGSCSGYQEIKLARSTDGGRTWSEVTLFGSGGLAWNTTASFAYPAIDTNPARTQLHVVVNYGGLMLFTKNVSLANWNQSAAWTQDGGVRSAPYEGAERVWVYSTNGDAATAPAITVDADNHPHVAYGIAAGQVYWVHGIGGAWAGSSVSMSSAGSTQDVSIDYGYGPNQSGVMEERIHVLFGETSNTLRYNYITKNLGGLFADTHYSGAWSMANGGSPLRGFSIVAQNGKVWAVGAFGAGAGSWVTKAAYSCDNGDRFGQPGDTCGYGYNGGQTVSAVLSSEGYPSVGYSPTGADNRIQGAVSATQSTVSGYRWLPRYSTFVHRTTLQSDPVAGEVTDAPHTTLERERPDTSAEFAYCWYVSEGTVAPLLVDEIRCNVEPAVYYRSIDFGNKNEATLGTVSATTGSTQVAGSGGTTWQTDNWGRGDRITIDGVTYAVSSVLSNTSLVLASPFLGTTGSGKAYTIGRQFKGTNILQTWENCISGASACPYFPVTTSSLVADNRREIGIVYDKDNNQHTGTLDIDGSTTDFVHSITLTVAPGNRHSGWGNTGAFIGAVGGASAIAVRDTNVTVEWLRITGGSSGTGGGAIQVDADDPSYNGLTTIRHNLVVNTGSHGILVGTTTNRFVLDIFNNVIDTGSANVYRPIQLSPSGNTWNLSDVYVANNTAYGRATASSTGIAATPGGNSAVVLVNNIAHSFTTCFGVPAPWGSGTGTNLSSDGTAPVSGERGVPLSGVGGVNFVDPVAQNFHLQSSSQAVNRGTTLATTYIYDIDNQARVSTWDIGADEYNGFTAVRLASFMARGFDSAVFVEWETASELDNLGFHLYRGLSENGPWERLTQTLIPGLGSSPEGKRYSFLDAGLRNGATYFYRLEDVDRSGRVTSHGPVSATPLAGAGAPPSEPAPPSPRRRRGRPSPARKVLPLPTGPRTATRPTSRSASSSARARA